MAALIATLSADVPKPLQELITLGRTLKKRGADVLAYFDRPPLCQAVVRHSDFPEFTFFEGMTGVTPNHEQPELGSRRWAG